MAYRLGRFCHGDTYYDCLRSVDAGAFTLTERRFPRNYVESKHYHALPYMMAIFDGGLSEGGVDYGEGDLGYQPAAEHTSVVHDHGAHVVVIESNLAGGETAHNFSRVRFHHAISEIVAEFGRDDEYSALAIEGIGLNLWAQVNRAQVAATKPCPNWLSQVAERLIDDHKEHLTLASLANEVSVHPVTLAKCFQRQFGCRPAEFARNTRLARAGDLLASSRMDIGEIALQTGFADQSHLARWFRRKYGVTPSEFRSLYS